MTQDTALDQLNASESTAGCSHGRIQRNKCSPPQQEQRQTLQSALERVTIYLTHNCTIWKKRICKFMAYFEVGGTGCGPCSLSNVLRSLNRPAASRILLNSMQKACTSMKMSWNEQEISKKKVFSFTEIRESSRRTALASDTRLIVWSCVAVGNTVHPQSQPRQEFTGVCIF